MDDSAEPVLLVCPECAHDLSGARTAGERPVDAFERCRLLLADSRRLGEPFAVAWPKALDAAAPVIVPTSPRARYLEQVRGDDRAALEALEAHWHAAFERRDLPRPPRRRATFVHPSGRLSCSRAMSGGKQLGDGD